MMKKGRMALSCQWPCRIPIVALNFITSKYSSRMIERAKKKFSKISCFWLPLFLNKKIVANDTNPDAITESIKNKLASILKKIFPLSSAKTGSNQISIEVIAERKSHNVWILCIIR